MLIQPYLDFNGQCEEALAFYEKALGAKVESKMLFKDNPDLKTADCPGGSSFDPNKIMHCSFRIGDNVLMASDCYAKGKPSFQGFNLSLTVKSPQDADKYFANLAASGNVIMPLSKTFWSPRFGMVTDKFGINWMINTEPS